MSYKYHFFNNYTESAHPDILVALTRTNFQQELGYSHDTFTLEVTRLIQEAIKMPQAAVHFAATGTQANLVCLAALLKSYGSVIAVDSGHINVYEAGAIEATGHKVHALPAVDGKLTPDAVQVLLDSHTCDQKVVYIFQSTEIGKIYTKQELLKLAEISKKNNLYLFVDGARLGHALMAENTDLTLRDIVNVADIFYIGGLNSNLLMIYTIYVKRLV